MASAARVIGAGAIIGLVLSVVMSRVVATLLVGVEPLDPVIFVAVAVTLMVTATVAVAAPAWRATRIDPAAALRGQ